MDSEERKPDTTDAGEGRDIGQGYPEEQPGGTSPEGESPDKSGGGGPASDRAPATDPGADRDPDKATGNPGAAG
jgi:hypothetical protein